MAYTVVWFEQQGSYQIRMCLPYQYYTDAAEHAKWLISQGVAAYIDIEELN